MGNALPGVSYFTHCYYYYYTTTIDVLDWKPDSSSQGRLIPCRGEVWQGDQGGPCGWRVPVSQSRPPLCSVLPHAPPLPLPSPPPSPPTYQTIIPPQEELLFFLILVFLCLFGSRPQLPGAPLFRRRCPSTAQRGEGTPHTHPEVRFLWPSLSSTQKNNCITEAASLRQGLK